MNQRHDQVPIKRTERNGLLNRKAGKVAAPAGHPDTDKVAETV